MTEPAGAAAAAPPAGRIDPEVLRQAADWFALLHADAVSEADRQRWQAWLVADVQHTAAWRRVEALGQQFQDLPAEVDRPAALRALSRPQPSRRSVLKAVAWVGVGGTSGWLAVRQAPWERWQADYATAVGAQRELALAGARVWLNTDSALDLLPGAEPRTLQLRRGEVLVDATGAAHATSVAVPQGQVHSAAGRFSLRLVDSHCQVQVFSGEVEIACAEAEGPRLLGAGRQQRFDTRSLAASTALPAQADAWTRGMLVADDQRLGDFLAELSRYESGRIDCAPEVADLRLVGAFPLRDPAGIYQALAQSLPVRVLRPLPGWVRVVAA